MRFDYKILWIDDYPDDMEAVLPIMRDIIASNHLNVIGLDEMSCFQSYEIFYDQYLKNFDKDKFYDCDLILVDYNISSIAGSGHTGKDLIMQLRNKGIFTDILFYSGNFEELRKGVSIDELDAVTYSDSIKEKIVPKFSSIIEKQMKLRMNIADIRGYLIDCTSDFDFMSKQIVLNLYDNLLPEKKQDLLKLIKGYIEAQKKKEESKFKKIESKYGMDSLIGVAMDSLEYVMTNLDKYRVLGYILEETLAGEIGVKTGEFDLCFDEKIIKPRNKMAHAKLILGDKKDHIRIAKTIDDLTCNCETCDNTKYLSAQQILQLRKDIQRYYNLLTQSFEKSKKRE